MAFAVRFVCALSKLPVVEALAWPSGDWLGSLGTIVVAEVVIG